MLQLLLAASLSHSAQSSLLVVKKKLKTQGFTQTQISKFFSDPRLKVYTQQTIASKPVDWSAYQSQLLLPASVDAGAAFIKAHQAVFDRAEKTYGVPKEMIAAIMRVETNFGLYTGSKIVPNVFYSFLAHNQKVKWAESNLVATLVYARQEKVSPFTLKGSYAGAIGFPQFLPSSILTYGVDGNGDKKVNLFDVADAAPSLANFLAKHGYANDQSKALTSYYGSSVGYPDAAIAYAKALASANAR